MNRKIKTSGLFPNRTLRALALLVAIFLATTAFAYDFEVGGIYYTKNGDGASVKVSSSPYYGQYQGQIEIPSSITYEGTNYIVTEIDYNAFMDCNNLTEVIMPNSIKTIGWCAFAGSSITRVSIPNSVTSMESGAFQYCKSLINVSIGNSIIGDCAFYECTALSSVNIGTNVDSIAQNAFYGCSSISTIQVDSENINFDSRQNSNAIIKTATNTLVLGCKNSIIPNNVTAIGEQAFAECVNLENIVIPNSVTTIGNGAFYGCTGLTELRIPDSVSSIGYNAFYQCYSITNLVLGNSIADIGDFAFWGCNGLDNLIIPNSVKRIGCYAFSDCQNLVGITIGASVDSIGLYAFSSCPSLSTIIVNPDNHFLDSRNNCNAIIKTENDTLLFGCKNTVIPNSIKVIGEGAFYCCKGLTEIEIPNSVYSIENNAFYYCTDLETICIPNSVINIGVDAFYNTLWYRNQDEGVIYAGLTAYSYKGTMPSGTRITLREGTKGIAGGAFSGKSNLVEITIPATVISIGMFAFSGCSGLTEMIIPDSVKEIPYAAFSNCSGLTHLVLGNSLALIDMSSFIECRSLTSLDFPNSLKKINPQAFWGCRNLASVSFGDSIEFIGYSAFEECVALSIVNISNLSAWCNIDFEYGASNPIEHSHSLYLNYQEIKDLVIPDNVTKIKSSTFRHCSGLTSLTINNGTKSIEEGAFYGCDGLESVSWGNSIQTIGSSAFGACTKLDSISIPNSVDSIGYYAFSGCTNLNYIKLPNSIKTLERGVFSKCSGLKNVFIPNSVTSIGSTTIQNQYVSGTFSGCSSLEKIIIPQSVVSIGTSAFTGCNSLTEVTCLAHNPPTIYQSTFNNTIYNHATLQVRKASVLSYTTANYWKEFANIEALPEINMVAFTDTATLHGHTIVIPVSLENESELTAFQTDLYLPKGFELVKEDGDYLVELSDRKGRDHVIMANDLDDGGIRIISYSTTVKSYSGNEGELFYITVKTPDDGDGDYTIMLKNTLLTTTDHEELNAPDASCTVTVYPYIMGDANNSGTVTVTDIVVTARYILNYHPDPFVFGAADMNGDNNITVTDIVIIAQMILDGVTTYPRYAPSRGVSLNRMIGNAMSIDGTRHNVSIALDNAADYTAFQLDLHLPAGMTAENFTLTDGSSSHTLDVNLLDNGKTRLLCYAPTLQALSGNGETLLTFDVTYDAVANRDIVVDGIEMVTTDCQTVNLNAFTIKLDNITSVDELKANARIYSDGQNIVVESPVDVTVNVSDLLGRTTLVKAKAGRTVIPTDGNGIYIVNAGGAVAKLMLK